MKIRNLCAAAAALALLCGCAAEHAAWECVNDEPVWSAARTLPEPYSILCALPQDAEKCYEDATCTVYRVGEDTISTEILPASTPEAAIRALSGFPSERLRVLQLQFGDLPAYRFAWCCETEEGRRYRQAMLVTDEEYYYAVAYDAAAPGTDAARSVFASFGLFYDEGV